jgi:hypothetical protein
MANRLNNNPDLQLGFNIFLIIACDNKNKLIIEGEKYFGSKDYTLSR